MDVIEPYHPQRVFHQFRHVQSIPPPPYAPVRASRGANATKYRVSYQILDQFWITWANNILSPEHRGGRVTHAWDCAPDYLEWF